MNQSTIKNPFDNSTLNANELSSINIPGIQPANISYLPIPGQDLAIPINPDEQNNSKAALKNLLPNNIVPMPNIMGAIPGMPPMPGLPP